MVLIGSCVTKNANNDTQRIAGTLTDNDGIVTLDGQVDNNIPALYTKWPFYVGAAVPHEALKPSNSQYGLLRHFNVYVAENIMKPEDIMPKPWTPTGAYRWNVADTLVDYAEANNKKIRGHVLFWHSQTPKTFFSINGGDQPVTIDELYARMENHIKTVFEKYGGRVKWWDVCNEVVGDDGNPRPGGFSDSQSPYTQIMENAGKKSMDRYEYVLKAFQWARKYADANGGQDVKLFLTDYGIEFKGAKQNAFLQLLDYLIANNAPIDGVGIQGHISYDLNSVNIKDWIENAIDSFSARQRGGKNLIVHVCELDISLYNFSETNWNNILSSKKGLTKGELDTRLKQQTALYRKLFDMFERKYNQGKLEMVLVWGLADGESWLNSFPLQRNNYPLLFDRNYQPKSAYNELIKGR